MANPISPTCSDHVRPGGGRHTPYPGDGWNLSTVLAGAQERAQSDQAVRAVAVEPGRQQLSVYKQQLFGVKQQMER